MVTKDSLIKRQCRRFLGKKQVKGAAPPPQGQQQAAASSSNFGGYLGTCSCRSLNSCSEGVGATTKAATAATAAAAAAAETASATATAATTTKRAEAPAARVSGGAGLLLRRDLSCLSPLRTSAKDSCRFASSPRADTLADLLAEAQAKFPAGACGPSEQDLTDILDTTSLIQAMKRYSSFAAGTDDQGWRIRQHLSLLSDQPDLLIPALSAIRRGGRFIPLSKGADKPGLRPIVIGSAHRRLATKLALAGIRSFLDQHFLLSHPRAIQFGLDRDGCLKFSQTASALLPVHTRGDDEDVANPTVLEALLTFWE
ncbi:hypothetical protein GUITHDRAFT_119938 [Guillardia theta CCMP2712]|uniref:Uncharacterized protein n=1 Tax=Guillardia theta (strain CCMP2712) TaxID=905079 RepID=L1ICE7_GUITC|nr:hypothetical protein GUITHDRAFT_119938 [Guillardia theta CCMP2712]EKX33893.1 hypothetical protein GUITHDRAFT_119938 [Guillardia theta CCMP2712]|eukprot:XP_005820873.1 hypothetical protein GUITHDRAFT_119938 [Guillardia theta CCMP2712]